jgi:hypothetical protein
MKEINTYWGLFCIQYKDRKPCSNKMRTKKYHTVVNMLLSQQDMLLEYEELEAWKLECVLGFSMGCRILVFYSEPWMALMNYFHSEIAKSTHTVVHFEWKIIMYIQPNIFSQFDFLLNERNKYILGFVLHPI